MMGVMGPEAIERRCPPGKRHGPGDTRFRFEFRDAEGNWFQTNVTMMELDGKPSFMAMNFDITELKRAQQKSKENEKRYRTIFDTAGTGMISFGEGRRNHLGQRRVGQALWLHIDEDRGQARPGMPFFTEESLAKMKKYHEMRNSRTRPRCPRPTRLSYVDRAGRIHDGIINIQVVPGTQQRVASFQDMTELKRAQNEMYRADKMAALGQIIAGVAHEINNPNNFIYFNLPILQEVHRGHRAHARAAARGEPDLKILNMPYEEFLEDVFKLLENMEHGSKRITEHRLGPQELRAQRRETETGRPSRSAG